MTSETALSAAAQEVLGAFYVAPGVTTGRQAKALDALRNALDAAWSQPATEVDAERLADAIEAYVRSAKGDPSPWARNAEDIATDLAAEYAALAATEPAATGDHSLPHSLRPR